MNYGNERCVKGEDVMSDKLVSVIVPAYNVEKTIGKCLDSIIAQTYKNIEIIVVNDGSTDGTTDILRRYRENYPQIKICEHEKNMGLFAARITGVRHAGGDYIGLVDSDDYISKDYFRELEAEAEDKSADIVVARIVQENQEGYKWIQNIYEDYSFGVKKGEDIWNSYWEQEGQLFIWHTVWNKLYSAEIWKKALPVLEKLSGHLIMCEDFVFSSVLFYYAETLSEIKYSRYFYYRNENASTALNGNVNKFEKNIRDLINAFTFVKGFLESRNADESVMKHYDRWEALYKYFWTQNVLGSSLPDRDKTRMLSLLNEGMSANDAFTAPNYFYSVSTEFDGRYENIVEWIVRDETKIVSFDIFDTALLRPFYRPTDMFELLDDEFCRLAKNRTLKFSLMRIEAEKSIRNKKIYGKNSCAEDVTIKEIYDEMAELFHINGKLLLKMQSLETEYEKRFLRRRDSVYNLYRIALHCNKTVIFTSDMYLDEKTISSFLQKNGYDTYDRIFVSAENDASKSTGKLYDIVLKHYSCDGNNIVHIGDSWESDIIMARQYRICAMFYPKTVECLEYGISDIKSTHALSGYKGRNNSIMNFEFGLKYLGNRCAIAVAANYLFDMPFKSYNQWSELNASPQFFGYFAVGMHLLGFTRWLNRECMENSYNQLAFIARDGYLPMCAYRILAKYDKRAISNTVWFCTSRKAAVPCGIKSPQDFYALYEELGDGNMEKSRIVEYLSPLLKKDFVEKCGTDSSLKQKIKDVGEFCSFVEEALIPNYDRQQADRFQSSIREYFEKIFTDRSALVDIGYSGRTQEMLYRTLGRSIDAFYVHKNDDACDGREKEYRFKVRSFYDFTPSITGAQRELIFSALQASCIGYELIGDEIKPCFEKVIYEYPYKYLVSEIQSSALGFMESFCEQFGTFMDNMYMRNIEVSYPFEHILAYLEDADMKLFDCILFEDDMWAGSPIALSERWRENISYHRLLPSYKTATQIRYVDRNPGQDDTVSLVWKLYDERKMAQKNIFSKAIFWLVNDRSFFAERLKHRKGRDEG